MTTLSNFIYVSKISPFATSGDVTDILKTARAFNKTAGITGILVFDGHRFLQYIEGPELALKELIQRIKADKRHREFQPKTDIVPATERIFLNWSMAYTLLDDSDAMDDLSDLNGGPVISKLQALVSIVGMK